MLVTDRFIIRCFEEKDLDSFMTYRNNDEWIEKWQSEVYIFYQML
jgi:hypothetical protein